jgi:hypothetical protein
MLSEKLKQLAASFADAVSEAVDEEMRSRMTNALSALGASGGDSGESRQRKTTKKTGKVKNSATPTKSGTRLARRSPEEIQAVVASVAKLVSKHKDGLRSETIRQELNLDVREVPRVLREGIASGALKVLSGHKRSTCYGAGSGRKAAGKGSKKAAKKAKKVAKASSKKTAKKVKAAPKKKAKASGKKATKKSKSTANGVAGHATAAEAAA